MHRSNFCAASMVATLCLSVAASLAGCDDSEAIDCPEGFSKTGKLCLQNEQEDSGDPVTVGERKDARADDPEPAKDAGSKESFDAGSEDAASANQTDSGTDGGSPMDGAADTADASDGSAKDGGTDGAASECDSTHACPSSGYFCMANKCVSACAQTQCTANSTCGLVRGAPVCTCNSGYLPVTTAGRLTSCTRDIACSDLHCDVNASCELGSNQIRHCVCKAEYVGDGQRCTRVTCPALSTLRIDNGRVSTSDGTTTVGKVAVFRCNDGYRESAGGPLVCDESGMWTGTPTVCSLITCAKPTATVEHASLTTPDQTSYRPNQTASYACASGYKPRGDANLTCKSDGTWTAPTLSCVAHCGDGVVDTAAPYNEECDPGLDPLSAWTCNDECKRCAGSLCRESCSTTTSCPEPINGLTRQCSAANVCALSNCNNNPGASTRRCPADTTCTNGTCTPMAPPASGS